MAKKSDNSFFSLIVPVAALIVTTTLIFQQTSLNSNAKTPKQYSYTFELVEGYNSIVSPLATDITMQDVCEELNLDEISRWDNHHEVVGPRTYNCADELLSQTEANMKITPDTPLVFKLNENRSWTVTGTKASQNYDVSVPSTYIFGFNTKRELYADSICKMLDIKGYGVKEVYRLDPAGWNTTHDCANPEVANFEVMPNVGYALFITDAESTQTPRSELQKSL